MIHAYQKKTQPSNCVKECEEYRVLHVHAVFGLLEDDASCAVDDLISHLIASVRRQTVHEGVIPIRLRCELFVDLIGHESFLSFLFLFFVAHADPDVGVDFQLAGRRLLAGMFAEVKLFLPGAEEALAIPREAALSDEGQSFVFVHHHGEYYVRRRITPGRSWAGLVEVREGLSVGQEVVADGAFLLKYDVLRSKMGAGCAD